MNARPEPDVEPHRAEEDEATATRAATPLVGQDDEAVLPDEPPPHPPPDVDADVAEAELVRPIPVPPVAEEEQLVPDDEPVEGIELVRRDEPAEQAELVPEDEPVEDAELAPEHEPAEDEEAALLPDAVEEDEEAELLGDADVEPIAVGAVDDRATGAVPVEAEEPAPAAWIANQADFRARWDSIQLGFVDQPREAVHDADALVGQVVDELTMALANARASIANRWEDDADLSTEDLRTAFRNYRDLFDRTLRAV